MTRYSYDRTAEQKTLDLSWLEGTRKDFLTLLKNVDRIRTYGDFDTFRRAVKTYRSNFDSLFFDRFLNDDLAYAAGIGKNVASWINQKVRAPAWSFSSDLSVPGGYPDHYNTKESCLGDFQRRAPKWKAGLQRKAREFWVAMKDVIEWYAKYREVPAKGPSVTVPERYQTVLEGFKVILLGYDTGYEAAECLERLKAGLHLYQQMAAKFAPILLKKQLPIIVDFEAKLDKGGSYNHDGTITFWAVSVMGHSEGWKWVTHVMAHEMGHHLFKTYLSEGAKDFWMQTIRGDYGDLDLGDLLKKWPDGALAFDMHKEMPDDPVLALQVESLTSNWEFKDTQSKEDFQALYDKGVRTLKVPKTPITGYANKNTEEAFCEALGLLIAFGPNVLHERIRSWLRVTFGGDVKVARSRSWERRKELDEQAEVNIPAEHQFLWRKLKTKFKGTPHDRYEQFMAYLEEHPNENDAWLQQKADKEIDKVTRQWAKERREQEKLEKGCDKGQTLYEDAWYKEQERASTEKAKLKQLKDKMEHLCAACPTCGLGDKDDERKPDTYVDNSPDYDDGIPFAASLRVATRFLDSAAITPEKLTELLLKTATGSRASVRASTG